MYYVYIISRLGGKLYIGITENPEQRVKYHNTKRGAKFTKDGGYRIVLVEEHETLSEARKRETQIKDWRREKKETLIKKYQAGLPTKIE